MEIIKKASAWVASVGDDLYNRADFLPGFEYIIHVDNASGTMSRRSARGCRSYLKKLSKISG
jgi:hypothetical protein